MWSTRAARDRIDVRLGALVVALDAQVVVFVGDGDAVAKLLRDVRPEARPLAMRVVTHRAHDRLARRQRIIALDVVRVDPPRLERALRGMTGHALHGPGRVRRRTARHAGSHTSVTRFLPVLDKWMVRATVA